MCTCGWVGWRRAGGGEEKQEPGPCSALSHGPSVEGGRLRALSQALGWGPRASRHQLRDPRFCSIKGEDGWSPLPLGAFTCDAQVRSSQGEGRLQRALGWVPGKGREGRKAGRQSRNAVHVLAG